MATKEIYFYSFALAGQTRESKYQIKFNSYLNTGAPHQPSQDELFAQFIMGLYETDVNEIEKYLDYHFSKYKGEKIDWWRYTKSRLEDSRTDYKTNQIIRNPHHEFVFDWFEKTKKQIEVKPKNTTQIYSYKWEDSKFNEVSILFNKIKGKLIDKNEELKNFKNVFSEKPIEEIIPIKWHEGNASQLLYFISQLMEKGKISKERRMNYERLKKCFVKNDNLPFDENLKVLKTKLEFYFSEDKKKPIDNFIRSLS